MSIQTRIPHLNAKKKYEDKDKYTVSQQENRTTNLITLYFMLTFHSSEGNRDIIFFSFFFNIQSGNQEAIFITCLFFNLQSGNLDPGGRRHHGGPAGRQRHGPPARAGALRDGAHADRHAPHDLGRQRKHGGRSGVSQTICKCLLQQE